MKQVSKLVAEFARRKPVRSGSLIISVFGDAVSQHGSAVWLGSLIRVLEPFGLNQRQIRTAVFRLVQQDWLVARQVGRRSYYSFTAAGQRHYEKAARRIYYAGPGTESGPWCCRGCVTTGKKNYYARSYPGWVMAHWPPACWGIRPLTGSRWMRRCWN